MDPSLQKGTQLAKVIEETVHIHGCPIHVRRSGEGRPLLYLHGAHGMGSWNPFFDALASRGHPVKRDEVHCRVLAVERIGAEFRAATDPRDAGLAIVR